MSDKKANWPVTIGIGVALGLALLVIFSSILRQGNSKQYYKVMLDLKLIKQAVEQYKLFHGHYPVQSTNRLLNFAEQLADVQPVAGSGQKRQMYVDFAANFVAVDNKNYAAADASSTSLIDPWGESYMYTSDGRTFTVWSSGPDRVNSNGQGDDISQVNLLKEASQKSSLR